jgi:hypothetical protein
MGTTRIKLGLVLICSACIMILTAPPASAASNSGGYSVRPAEIDQNDPATRAYFKPVLAPGKSATHHIVVTNLDSVALHLLINSVDGLTGQTSGSVYANRQDPVAKAGIWLTPSSSSITIAPHATATVAFAIRVPRDAKPGDHLAGIAFENTATNSSGGSFAVKQIIREVVGVLVRVPGPASEGMSIGSLALQSLPGTSFASVIVNLTNTGQLLCKPALTVAMHGPNGSARTVTRTLDTILPGDTIAYPLPWPDTLAAGSYVARASTSACGPAAATADVPLVLGAPLNGSQPSNEPARVVRTPNLSIILTVGLALAALLFGLLIGKRRRRKEEEHPVVAPMPVRRRPMPLEAAPSLRRIATLEEHKSLLRAPRGGEIATKSSEAPEQQSLWP